MFVCVRAAFILLKKQKVDFKFMMMFEEPWQPRRVYRREEEGSGPENFEVLPEPGFDNRFVFLRSVSVVLGECVHD